MKHQRQSIIFKIHDELSQRLALSIQQRDDLILSRNEDIKSSAADKYETSREMVQQEIDHIESQIFNQKLLLQELKEIRMSKISDSIQKGSIIETEKSLLDRKSTRLNSSHVRISYAVFCLKKKTIT